MVCVTDGCWDKGITLRLPLLAERCLPEDFVGIFLMLNFILCYS